MVPAWFMKINPGAFENWVPRGAQGSTRIELTQEDWDNFFQKFPGPGMCATTPAHNAPEARAMMKANGQKHCPCVSGYNLK